MRINDSDKNHLFRCIYLIHHVIHFIYADFDIYAMDDGKTIRNNSWFLFDYANFAHEQHRKIGCHIRVL